MGNRVGGKTSGESSYKPSFSFSAAEVLQEYAFLGGD